MVKFIGDRCHADTLSGIAERFGTGYLQRGPGDAVTVTLEEG